MQTARRTLIFLFFSVFLLFTVVQSARATRVGWYSDVTDSSRLAGYANQGANQMLANGAGWLYPSGISMVINYLNVAQSLGIKVIVPVGRGRAPDGVTDQQYTDFINTIKTHPALVGYYLSDEPELDSYPNAVHATLQHYYSLGKAADPNHPFMVAFSGSPSSTFSDIVDMVGCDYYPARTDTPTFGGQIPGSYDTWARMLRYCATYGKASNVAIVQGTDKNGYRDLSDAEYRYHIFSAIVQGVKNILFWYDGSSWASSTMINHVGQMMGQIKSIGAEMDAGTTFDPRITVNQPISSLAYRYGVSGSSNVILAVNIANRNKVSGARLVNVQFSLPSEVHTTQIEVLHENRAIPVVNGKFTDDFAPFAVHMYKFVQN